MKSSIVDPVCWMDVAAKSIAATSEYKGQIFYFCSIGCKESFDKEPEHFLSVGDDDTTQSKENE